MKLIEIRNNLIKLSYEENERPTLGQFIALTGVEKSYVAQYVNLKADNINNFAVAKLMFSFNADGVVSEYDGSAPSINSNIVELPANELLDLLPVDTALKIGQISGCNDELNVDISIFEHNFTVFCETDYEKTTVISNCVRQLFRMKEKSVILDCDDLFEEYPRITLSKDFKLPLNSGFIDFIFEHDLKNVDAATKAVIQDIFYAVQQYIKTLDDEFLPIESFIDVVTAQYKETQMPELALLKNKLLKYKDAGIFANEPDEYKQLEQKLKERNCIVINIKEANGDLQREIINYVHKIIETFDKYVYYFVPLTDDNSDKKLVKRLINHSHVFTTFFASHLYKYASELKSHAQNILFFAPQTMQNDFAAYNTFLNKLNQSEGVIYGNLTQGIPLIITLEDLELDLTKDDVFGDRQRFVPAIEEDLLSSDDIYAINNLQEAPTPAPVQELPTQEALEIQEQENYLDEISNEDIEEFDSDEAKQVLEEQKPENISHDEITSPAIEKTETEKKEPPIENILADDDEEDEITETFEPEQTPVAVVADTTEEVSQEVTEESVDDEDDLSFMDDFHSVNEESEQQEEVEDFPQDEDTAEQLTEDDLDLIENSGQIQSGEEVADDFADTIENEEDTPPVVPVYDTEDGDEIANENIGFKAGDRVSHPRYGNGTVEKIIKYGNKTLCSIDFENVGRRLLDPSISDFEKI
ncbi:hypothetical protein J6O86_01605 [bacterium]|nr:hypothetical protein [bacterium]